MFFGTQCVLRTYDTVACFAWCCQGRLISLCADSSLHLWQINSNNGDDGDAYSTLDELASCTLSEGRLVYWMVKFK